MRIELKFINDGARTVEYFLQKRYNSKAKLEKLIMLAVRREVADEAKNELGE
jgi:hypothetical protein